MKRLLLALCLASPTLQAATFTVTRFDDPPIGACLPGDCSLREALGAAAQAGADTVQLAAGDYVLAGWGEHANPAVSVPADTTLLGAGSSLTRITASSGGTMFFVGDGAATFRRLTIHGATDPGNAYVSSFGGAIRGFGSKVTIDQSVLRDNTISQGGALTLENCELVLRYATLRNNHGPFGGGAVQLLDTPTTVYRTVIEDNSGSGGGAFRAQGSPIRVQAGSVLRRNHATHHGGAVLSNDEFIADDDTVVDSNSAQGGGGAFADFGKGLVVRGVKTTNGTGMLLVSNSSAFDNNGAFGGAFFLGNGILMENVDVVGSQSNHSAGAIYAVYASVTIRDSRFAGNHAEVNGGAGFFAGSSVLMERVAFESNTSGVYGGALTFSGSANNAELRNVDFYDNRAPRAAAIENGTRLLLRHATFWNNVSDAGRDAINQTTFGNANYANSLMLGRCTGTTAALTASGNNLRTLESSSSCGGSVAFLLALSRGSFGGRFAVSGTSASGSPLVNAGAAAFCEPRDIRNRVRDGKCDVGAFEYGAP